MSLQPHGEKLIFLDFLGFNIQIEGRQNIVSTLITFYLIVNRLIEGNGQNQAKELCVLRYNVLVPFLFLFFVLVFISSFSCLFML